MKRESGPKFCSRCNCEMVPPYIAKNSTPEQRAEWLAAGKKRSACRRVCINCYTYLQRHGLLDTYARADGGEAGTPKACPRCGVQTLTKLCLDCTEYVADRGEAEQWGVSPAEPDGDWIPVPGWPDVTVDSNGRVRGPSGKTLTPQRQRGARTQHVVVRQRKLRIHLAVLLAFTGPSPDGYNIVRWIDGNPRNNRLENLQWVEAMQATERRAS